MKKKWKFEKHVFKIQVKLNKLGWKLKEDGLLGKKTETAIIEFQTRTLLIPDGIVGPITECNLDAAIYHEFDKNKNQNNFPFKNFGTKHPKHRLIGRLPETYGRISTFGGPFDRGDLMYGQSMVAAKNLSDLRKKYPQLLKVGVFRNEEIPKTIIHPKDGKIYKPGLSWLLNPDSFYIAMRFSYWMRMKIVKNPLNYLVLVSNSRNGRACYCAPTDFGPAKRLKRVCDLSPGATDYLKLKTDQTATLLWGDNNCPIGPAKRFGILKC